MPVNTQGCNSMSETSLKKPGSFFQVSVSMGGLWEVQGKAGNHMSGLAFRAGKGDLHVEEKFQILFFAWKTLL